MDVPDSGKPPYIILMAESEQSRTIGVQKQTLHIRKKAGNGKNKI
jgi:hypothetical protein